MACLIFAIPHTFLSSGQHRPLDQRRSLHHPAEYPEQSWFHKVGFYLRGLCPIQPCGQRAPLNLPKYHLHQFQCHVIQENLRPEVKEQLGSIMPIFELCGKSSLYPLSQSHVFLLPYRVLRDYEVRHSQAGEP